MKILQLGSKNQHVIKNIRIAALVTGAAILLLACENDIEKIKAFSITENLPVVEAKNFETLFTDSGQVRFFLKAPKLLRFETDGTVYIEFPEGMELVKYDQNKRIISSITSDYAKQFVKEKRWEAKNNVIATNASGDTLKTEVLIWEEEAEKIYTEESVEIIRPDQIITGIGFSSDQTLENWKITKPKGTIYVTLSNESTEPDSLRHSPGNRPNELKPQPFQEQLDFKK